MVDYPVTAGIDLGKSLGLALVQGSEVIYAVRKILKKGTIERYTELFGLIENIVNLVAIGDISTYLDIALACIEDPPMVRYLDKKTGLWTTNVVTYGVLSRYCGAAAAALGHYEVPTKIINNKRCKKYITGKGNASKEDVRIACAAIARDDTVLSMPLDATDALANAYYAQFELGFDWRKNDI